MTIEAPHYHVFGSLLPCMLVASFSTGVQHVISVMSMGFLTGKTLSGVLVVHIVCIVGHRNGHIYLCTR